MFRSSEVKLFFKDEVKIRLISTKKQKKGNITKNSEKEVEFDAFP